MLDDLARGETWLRVLGPAGRAGGADVARITSRPWTTRPSRVRRLAPGRLAGAFAPEGGLIAAVREADRFTRRALVTGVASAERRDVAPALWPA
ncbi:MAG: hypothetical protein R3F43_11660 [bacterium]